MTECDASYEGYAFLDSGDDKFACGPRFGTEQSALGTSRGGSSSEVGAWPNFQTSATQPKMMKRVP